MNNLMNHKKKLCLNKKIFLLFTINTFFITYGSTLSSFLKKTDNNIGHKIQTIIGPFIVYSGWYTTWKEWKKMINGSQLGPNAKNILTLWTGTSKHTFNYVFPLTAMFFMPRVNIQDGLHLYSNLFNTLVTTLKTTKRVPSES